MIILLAFTIFLSIAPPVYPHHVMFVHNFGTKSQIILMKPIAEELLERGNQVTSIIFSSMKISHPNYTEIMVPADKMENMMKESSKRIMDGGGSTLDPSTWWLFYNIIKDNLKEIALDIVTPEKVKKMIKNKVKVDLVLTQYPWGAIFAEIFDCPVILFSGASPISFMMEGTTNVINLSVQPCVSAPVIEPMGLVDRISNHLVHIVYKKVFGWISLEVASHMKEYLEAELDASISNSLDEILKERVSLLLACSHPITHGAWQYLPNIIEVGGLQLKDPKPLPKNLEEFMTSATKGAVFVSFGSSLKPDQMPKEKLQVFVDTFKKLDMSIIFKWDAEIQDLPKNVLLSSWVPQQDLLAHPNLKVFVTHGGLGSLVEAIYHKAVVVGIPLSNDQKPNMIRAERHGYAARLNWDNITAEELVSSIQHAMEDKEMEANMERIHEMYVDRKEKPLEKAVWWVEYVCRHGGAKWFKSIGEDIPFLQYHHLDIILLMCLFLFMMLGVTLCFWKTVYRCCRATKPKVD